MHNETARACVEISRELISATDKALLKAGNLELKRTVAHCEIKPIVILLDMSICIGSYGLPIVTDCSGENRERSRAVVVTVGRDLHGT